jgi:hypothetical protein
MLGIEYESLNPDSAAKLASNLEGSISLRNKGEDSEAAATPEKMMNLLRDMRSLA